MKRFRSTCSTWTSCRSILYLTAVLASLAMNALNAQSQIALSSDRTSRFQIYTQQISPLTAPVQVTTGGGGSQVSSEPEWSPDGTLIAYQFGAPGVRGIHTIHPDGTGDTQITPPGSGSYPCTDDTEPAWSPDGRYIAYGCLNSGIGAIWQHDNTLPPNNPSSESLVFALSKGLIFNPPWSRDGTSLVFVTSVPGSGQPQIQQFTLASRTLKPLTSSSFNDFDPTFSPDGQTIAFSSTRNGARQIFTMSVSCPETHCGCPAPTQLTMDPSGAQHCAWSSDGQWVAFVSNRITTLNPTGKWQIYLLSPTQPEGPSNPVVPVSDGTATDDFPAWPAGSHMQPAKALGNPWDIPGGCKCGDPIDPATGNVFEQLTDYERAGQNKLRFVRSYNSSGITVNPNTLAKTLGVNWRSMYDRYLTLVLPTSVTAERADGQVLTFTSSGGMWKSDTDVDLTLIQSGTTWTLTDHDDTVETYSAVGTKATLTSHQSPCAAGIRRHCSIMAAIN
jgi:Tol biopolymer transport system component